MDLIRVYTAAPLDLPYIVGLMRANRESVGGLPEPAIVERIERGTVLLAAVNGDPVGYLLYDVRDGRLRIPQACIQYDARRRKYGEALMARALQFHGDVAEIGVRCAADLEANVFWRDMGFTCIGTTNGGRRRGRTINLWGAMARAAPLLRRRDRRSTRRRAPRRLDLRRLGLPERRTGWFP